MNVSSSNVEMVKYPDTSTHRHRRIKYSPFYCIGGKRGYRVVIQKKKKIGQDTFSLDTINMQHIHDSISILTIYINKCQFYYSIVLSFKY